MKAGLTSDEATQLSRAFGVDAAFADGSVRYVSPSFGDVPMKPDIKRGKDEDGRPTVGSFFDLAAIRAIKPIPNQDAIGRVLKAFSDANVPIPEGATPSASHTALRFQPRKGDGFTAHIDTSVRFDFQLAGLPLVGPGADIGATFDPNGAITDLQGGRLQGAAGRVGAAHHAGGGQVGVCPTVSAWLAYQP